MAALLALTRDVSASIVKCELTHIERLPIDVKRARAQHDEYERALEAVGCTVQRLPATDDMPDSVFVEDIAIVLDELAVITRPGAVSRRAERAVVMEALAPYRTIVSIEAPGIIDGGDVLVVGRSIFIGTSSRTNHEAVEQVRRHVAGAGYRVHPVTVHGCLHLKSAVTAISDDTLLVNPAWAPIDDPAFRGFQFVDVHSDEPSGANVVRIGGRLIYPSSFPKTRERLETRGLGVTTVDVSELQKAEGAVTCCSVILRV